MNPNAKSSDLDDNDTISEFRPILPAIVYNCSHKNTQMKRLGVTNSMMHEI